MDQARASDMIKTCLETLSSIMGELEAIARAAKVCVDADNTEAGLHIAMDLEPLLTEANTLLNCACIIKRRAATKD